MRKNRVLRTHVRDRFVFTLKSGETFDGLLDDHDETMFDLIDVFHVTKTDRVPVDGRLFLARADVAYMQLPVSR